MSWEKEEAKSRHVDFQCVRSRSVNSLLDANDGKRRRREQGDSLTCKILFPFQNKIRRMLCSFLSSKLLKIKSSLHPHRRENYFLLWHPFRRQYFRAIRHSQTSSRRRRMWHGACAFQLYTKRFFSFFSFFVTTNCLLCARVFSYWW